MERVKLEYGNVRTVKEYGELSYYILVFSLIRHLCILNYVFEM